MEHFNVEQCIFWFFIFLWLILIGLLIFICVFSFNISKNIDSIISAQGIDDNNINNRKVLANIISIQERELDILARLGKSILTTITICFVSLILIWGVIKIFKFKTSNPNPTKSHRDTVYVNSNINNINNSQNYKWGSSGGHSKKHCLPKTTTPPNNCCNSIIDSIHSATKVIVKEIKNPKE